MKKYEQTFVIMLARTISSIGTYLTASSIPIFLVDSNRGDDIPLNSICLSLATVLGSFIIVPYLKKYSFRHIIMGSSAIGFISFAMIAFQLSLLGNKAIPPVYLLYMITFASTVLITLETNVSQPVLGKLAQSGRLVHLDSSLNSLSRALSPVAAASLLLAFHDQLSVVLALDALSFLVAGVLYYKLKVVNEIPANQNVGTPQEYGIISSLKKNWRIWLIVCTVSIAASTFNVGVLAHAAKVGLTGSDISFFMALQNIVMLATNVLLTSFPILPKKIRFLFPFLSGAGMLLMAFANSLLMMNLGTSLMAFGMIIFIQGARSDFATADTKEYERRQDLATFSIINSLLNLSAGLMWIQFSSIVGWKNILVFGGVLFLLLGLILHCIASNALAKRQLRESRV